MYILDLHTKRPVSHSQLQRLHTSSGCGKVVSSSLRCDKQMRRVCSNVSEHPVLAVQAIRDEDIIAGVVAKLDGYLLRLEAKLKTWSRPP